MSNNLKWINTFSMSLIMFTWDFSHLFANPQWIKLKNQTSIDLKPLARCYVTLPPYVKPITSTLVKLKICRTFTKTRVHYPMCELYYLINNQSNHLSLEVEFCAKLKHTAAVMWTTLQTSMDMILVYIFVSLFTWKMWIQPTCSWETTHARLRHDMLVNLSFVYTE